MHKRNFKNTPCICNINISLLRCQDMLLYCGFGKLEFNCTELFRSVLTDDGLCCQFNAQKKAYLIREEIRKK